MLLQCYNTIIYNRAMKVQCLSDLEHALSATEIRLLYYAQLHTILGKSKGRPVSVLATSVDGHIQNV